MAVTMFNSHTFHGLDKNLRDTLDALILKPVPTNLYDLGILKRYFDAQLLEQFIRNGRSTSVWCGPYGISMGSWRQLFQRPRQLDLERHGSSRVMVETIRL